MHRFCVRGVRRTGASRAQNRSAVGVDLGGFLVPGGGEVGLGEHPAAAPYGRLLYWHKRLAPNAPPGFIQLLPVATATPAASALIRLHFHGVHLELREDIDPEHLAQLVDALARTRTPC